MLISTVGVVSRWGVATLLLCAASAASAIQLEGISLPERMQIGGNGPLLVLNGAGVRYQAIVKVYVSALYLPSRNSDSHAILRTDEPRRLALHFLRAVKATQFTDSTNEALQATLTPEERRPLESRMSELNKFLEAMPDIKEGTEVLLDYLPKVGTLIRVDGEEKHRIPGADFNKALMRVWLGERARDPKLKQAMLGAPE